MYSGGVYWFELNKGTPEAAFQRFAAYLEENADLQVLSERLRKKLAVLSAEGKYCLFIFDEAEDYDGIKQYLDTIDGSGHHVIITSCAPKAEWFPYRKNIVELKDFTPSQSESFIKRFFNLSHPDENTKRHINSLANECQNNPLLLNDTTLYIETTFSGSLEAYFKSAKPAAQKKVFREIYNGIIKKEVIKQEVKKYPDIHRYNFFTKFSLITNDLEVVAFKLLGVAAMFGGANIPRVLLSTLDDPLYSAIKKLCRLGLLISAGDGEHYKVPYAICKTVETILLYNKDIVEFPMLSAGAKSKANKQDSEKLLNIETVISMALEIIEKNLPDDFLQENPYTVYEPFIPHAINIVEIAIRYRTEEKMKSNKVKRAAKILLRCAYIYFVKGLLNDASELAEKALKLAINEYQEGSWELIIYHRVYGQILESKKNFNEAENQFGKATAIQLSVYTSFSLPPAEQKEYHTERATVYSCLAWRLINKATYDQVEGEELLKKAKESLEKAYEKKKQYCAQEPEFARTLDCLGDLLVAEGNANGAIKNYEEAYKIYCNFYSKISYYQEESDQEKTNKIEQHPFVASNRLRISIAYYLIGELLKAESILKPLLDTLKKLYGTQEHQEIVAVLVNLGRVYYWQGKYEEAEKVFNEILNLEYAKTQPLDQNVIDAIYYRGRLLIIHGKYLEARAQFIKALKEQYKLYDTSKIKINPNTSLSDVNTIIKLTSLLEVTDYVRILHRDVAKTIHYIGFSYYKLRQLDNAEICYQEAHTINERCKTRNAKSLLSKFGCASIDYQRGHYIESEKKHVNVLDKQKKYYGDKHFEVANTRRCLAKVYIKLAQFQDAKIQIDEAFSIWKDPVNIDYQNLPEVALTTITKAYLTWYLERNYQTAEQLLKEALTSQIKIYKTELHPNIMRTQASIGRMRYYQGDYPGAIQHYYQAKKIAKMLREPDKFASLELDHYIGDIYLKLAIFVDKKYYIDAEKQYNLAIQDTVDKDHPDTVSVLCSLARITREIKDVNAAEEYLKNAREKFENRFDKAVLDGHSHYALILMSLGKFYLHNNIIDTARQLYTQAIKILCSLFVRPSAPCLHHKLIEAYCDLALCVDKKTAEENINKAIAAFNFYYFKVKVDGNPRTITSFIQNWSGQFKIANISQYKNINLFYNLHYILSTLIKLKYKIDNELVTVCFEHIKTQLKIIIDMPTFINLLDPHVTGELENSNQSSADAVISSVISYDLTPYINASRNLNKPVYKHVAVFGGSSGHAPERHKLVVWELGKLLASKGLGLVYGGGNSGLIGCLADSVFQSSGSVIGVITSEENRRPEMIHKNLSTDNKRLHLEPDYAARKAKMIALSSGVIVLPGGLGTLDELSEMLIHNQFAGHADLLENAAKPIAIYNIDGFYNPFMQQISLSKEYGYIQEKNLEMLKCSENIEELIDFISNDKPPMVDDSHWRERHTFFAKNSSHTQPISHSIKLDKWISADQLAEISFALLNLPLYDRTCRSERLIEFAASVSLHADPEEAGSFINILNKRAEELRQGKHAPAFAMAINLSSAPDETQNTGNHWIYGLVLLDPKGAQSKCLLINTLAGEEYSPYLDSTANQIKNNYRIQNGNVGLFNTGHQDDDFNCGIWILVLLESTLNLLNIHGSDMFKLPIQTILDTLLLHVGQDAQKFIMQKRNEFEQIYNQETQRAQNKVQSNTVR